MVTKINPKEHIRNRILMWVFGILAIIFFIVVVAKTCPICEECQPCNFPDCPELDCSDCPKEIETVTKTETITKYVCQDESIVEKADDCIKTDEEGWYEVKTFSGSSTKDTEPVSINSDAWRFTWETDEDDFGECFIRIQVLDEGKTIMEDGIPYVQILTDKCGPETSYVYSGNGNFYFSVGAVENWNIKVEAQK